MNEFFISLIEKLSYFWWVFVFAYVVLGLLVLNYFQRLKQNHIQLTLIGKIIKYLSYVIWFWMTSTYILIYFFESILPTILIKSKKEGHNDQ